MARVAVVAAASGIVLREGCTGIRPPVLGLWASSTSKTARNHRLHRHAPVKTRRKESLSLHSG